MNGQSRKTNVPRIIEEYITQVVEEIEGRVTKKLSQEFNRTNSSVLGSVFKLEYIFLNPLVRTTSGKISGKSCNT